MARLSTFTPLVQGEFRTFGKFGPAYQVLERPQTRDRDAKVRVRVLQTGEELEYLISRALKDPSAR